MKINRLTSLAFLSAALSGLWLAGCERDNTPQSPPAAVLPAGLFLEQEPEGVISVLEAKRQAKEGDRVIVMGRIGGTRDPFVGGRAIMTIIDSSLPTCADKPEDCCETPWDYCCETRGDIVAHAVTVQVPAEGGGPLRADLRGAGRAGPAVGAGGASAGSGLEPMTEVVIVGRVGQTASPTAFLIEAEGIYIRR